MPPNSLGPVGVAAKGQSASISTRPSPSAGLPRDLPLDTRPAKRPRLSPAKTARPAGSQQGPSKAHTILSKGKENVPTAKFTIPSATKMTKDEQAMMDDLLAGLDASTFDMSPTKSQSTLPRSQVKLGRESPLKSNRSNGCAMPAKRSESSVKSELSRSSPVRRTPRLPVKIEVEDSASSSMAEPQVKTDKEMFEDLDDLCDLDFGDLSAFDEDLYQPPAPAIKYPIMHPAVPRPGGGYASTPWIRCSVEFVYEGLRFSDGVIPSRGILEQMTGSSGAGSPVGKTLICNTPQDHDLRLVHLKEAWMIAPIRSGDTINLITPTTNATPITISSKCSSSFLILHPDILLTMTSIANAMPCPRRPILNSLIKSSGAQSKAVVYGNLLHGLLQSSLQEQDFTPEGTQKRLEGMLKRDDVRLDVWGAGLNVRDVAQDLGDRAKQGFERFAGNWIGAKPGDDGELHSMPGESQELLAISGLHEVEEDIWSPKWGLKGKVDASVQAVIVRKAADAKQRSVFAPKVSEARTDQGGDEVVAPLEIKTGRAVGLMAHRAQTMLYTLLMEDRYGIPVPAGLLYYSQLDTILRVEAKTNEIRSLIMARNELANYLYKKRKLIKRPKGGDADLSAQEKPSQRYVEEGICDIEDAFLPPTIDNEKECQNCYAKDACMLYRKAVDRTPITPKDPIGVLYEETVGDMSEADSAFFRKWETLLTVEEQDMGKFRSQLWTMSAEEREQNGRCFANMIIDGYSNDVGKSLAKIHRHAYTFVRAPGPPTASASQASSGKVSFLSGHIAKGDPVSITIEPDLFALSRGYVLDLTPTNVTIGVQQIIDPSALLKRTTWRHATRQLSQLSLYDPNEAAHEKQQPGKVVFRIDKDEMTGGSARMRNNLAQLFLQGGNDKLRRIVVDHIPPRFSSITTGSTGKDDFDLFASQGPLASLPDVPAPESFNADQRQAMQQVLSAQDYALILGMPGTGKTTTIAEIIKAIVARGQTVLLTSYTHSAVDTILRKLVNEDIGMLRLGNVDKVHSDVQHLTLESMNASTSMGELGERLLGPPVVACTCLGIDHPLFQRRKFDYCIIDEASQITLPTALGPLRFADRFVLVGDHYQLPPIVKNHDARKAGLDVSLFKLLSEKRPESVTSLTFQYRMNEDIMTLSNRLIYEGRLRCGSDEVAQQTLKVARGVTAESAAETGAGGEMKCGHVEGECWIADLLNDEVKAVFVDTDAVPARDTRIGDLVQNPTEALLARQLSGALADGGIRQDDIAVITPYRQQIKLLTGLFQDLPRIEILTADKSQGRDKDVIIISLVRSNDSGNIGELLRDWRRINVSFTRAKKKLVIFGSRSTLSQDKLMGDFFSLMQEKKWIYALKRDAHRAPGHSQPAAVADKAEQL